MGSEKRVPRTLGGVKAGKGWGHPYLCPPQPSAPLPHPDGNWKAKVCSKVKKLIVLQNGTVEGLAGEGTVPHSLAWAGGPCL